MDAAARDAWNAARPGDPPFDTACVAPWVSLEFDPAGYVYACCTSQLYPLGRIGEQRLSELWDGPRARVLKSALRRWDFSVACQPCRFHLEHRRMDPAAAVYDQYPLADDRPGGPHMMLFALSNRCNLGCIMCSPALSSRLQAEAGLPATTSPYDDQFFDDLAPLLSELRLAKFLGGEPFLAPEHRRVWTLLDQLERPPKLSITTNGTIWTGTVDWLLDRFEVDISVSVDAATPETYAAVRRGGDLRVVHEHMDRFAERCRDRGTNLHVSYCLMPQNAHELGRFLVWAEPYTFGAPAYVNLVSDEGAALHDLSTAELDRIRAGWASEDAEISARLDRNAEVWRTQLDQLDDVLSARRSDHGPVATRAHPAAPDALALRSPVGDPMATPTSTAELLEQHRDQLTAWSGGGAVGEIVCDAAGVVVEVARPHERLGVDDVLVGAPVDSLLAVMQLADGRSGWLLDEDDGGVHVVRTLVLADVAPARGGTGAVVRVVQIASPPGGRGRWTYLLAEDRFYDADRAGAATATPVALAARGAGGTGSRPHTLVPSAGGPARGGGSEIDAE